MSLTSNRFDALLGEEDTEIDKLGNNKPIEKKGEAQPPTRREQRKSGQRQPAVSPPSKRDRGNRKDVTEGASSPATAIDSSKPPPTRTDRPGRFEGGGNGRTRREFDRHSGTGVYDTEKKVNKGWGEAGTAEYEGAHDVLDPNDPDAAETRKPFSSRTEEPEDNTKTLDEYLAEKKSSASNLRLDKQQRKANEGSDDTQWKGAVPLQKEEDVFFVGKEAEAAKLRTKNKKEKVYLEYDQPPRRAGGGGGGGGGNRGQQGRGRGGGRVGGHNNSRSGNRAHQGSVNLSDAKAFPTLGA